MKKLILFLIILLNIIACSNSENDINEENLPEINPNNFNFKLNNKEFYEDEIYLKIDNINGSLRFYGNNNKDVNGFSFVNNSKEEFVTKINETLDTIITYKKRDDISEYQGLRYIIKDTQTEIVELISINYTEKKIIVKKHFELTLLNSRKKNIKPYKFKISSDDDLEKDVDDTIQFFGDGSAHPVINFFKDIIESIKEKSSDVYKDSKEKFETLSNDIKDSDFADYFENIDLSKIRKKLNDSKDFIKSSSENLLNQITDKLSEDDIENLKLDNFDNYNEYVEPEFWNGTIEVTTVTNLDCGDSVDPFNPDRCGVSCQSLGRVVFGSSFNQKVNISYSYGGLSSSNNFRMKLRIGGTSWYYDNICYSANIQRNTDFSVNVNYYYQFDNSYELQPINFVITNNTVNKIEGTWSGTFNLTGISCTQYAEGFWEVIRSDDYNINCD